MAKLFYLLTAVQLLFGAGLASPFLREQEDALYKRADPVINELKSGSCKKIVVIYARGTGSPGNYDSVGRSLFSEVAKLEGGTGKVARQGVTYDAAIGGYLDGGSDDGGKELAALVRLAISKCPSSKIVLGGYSQGAQVIHKAMGQLSDSNAKAVDAITVFGDPYGTKAIPKISSSKVKKWCHGDDDVCHVFPTIPDGAHGGYEGDTPSAAKFIHSKL